MTAKAQETFEFQAEVSRLLDIVTNALYSNHEVFLRELISNSADACDRLRYEAIAKPELASDDPEFRIRIGIDTKTRSLTITDNGIGMSKKELVDNLGTIARSGTAKIMEQLKKSKDAAGTPNLIGQFGVGFYSSFMVADKVEVISRKADSKTIWHWESDGRSSYSMREADKAESAHLFSSRGTSITLHIKDEHSNMLIEDRLRHIITKYSDHIDVPVYMGEGEKAVNDASAIWTRNKSDITEEQYTNFYKSLSYGMDEPLLTSHWRAEGVIEYSALLYVPEMRPFDLYDPKRAHSVKLYVKKVFITDDCDGLVYPWLRFLRGVVDSQDLPLNISREVLQANPLVAKIRSGLTKRILSDLDKLSKNDEAAYLTFWGQFGAVLKEGLYDAFEYRDQILKLCRFFSSADPEKRISLEDYKASMKDGQKAIYYISGESPQAVKNAPQLEGFKERGISVLFMTDTIDEFWLQHQLEFDGLPFQSVTKAGDDFETSEDTQENQETKEDEFKALLHKMQKLLIKDVHNVRLSKRLKDSPVCFVAVEGGADIHMEKVLKIQQNYDPQSKPILEINPDHPVIKNLAAQGENADEDSLWLLYDQARILQGDTPKDPAAFTRRLNKFMGMAA